jgi:hypothetical protein
MELRTFSGLPTAAAPSLCQKFAWDPSMRLEHEALEESQILDLEKRIGDERDKGTIDSLVKEKRRTYDSWIERLDREIPRASGDEKVRLKRQRERAVREYGGN